MERKLKSAAEKAVAALSRLRDKGNASNETTTRLMLPRKRSILD